MKKYLFILAGVAFFSLLTYTNTYADEDIPPLEETHVDYVNMDGFARSASARGSTKLGLSCNYSQVGMINLFPLNGDQNCGQYVSNSSIIGSSIYSSNTYTFDDNGRTVSYSRDRTYFIDNLGKPIIYNASNYVSRFNSFRNAYDFGGYNHALTVPRTNEDGYAFYMFSISNLLSDFHSTQFAPHLSTSSKASLSVSGTHTDDEIIDIINSSGVTGFVWTDSDGVKRSTLNYCDATALASVGTECIKVIPDDETFTALESYIALLPDDTFFALYAFPLWTDTGYYFGTLEFETPQDMTAYNVDFPSIQDESAYSGMPMIYSTPYQNYNTPRAQFNALYDETYAIYISSFYMFPESALGFARSRSFAGQLVASNGNSIRYQNGLSQIKPNPGNSLWGNIFNLGNLIFPFGAFLSGFSNAQCINIPIIGSWLGSGSNQQYCSWWSADIRNVLTPIFAASSMMLLFGFIIHWLRKSNTDTLSYGDK